MYPGSPAAVAVAPENAVTAVLLPTCSILAHGASAVVARPLNVPAKLMITSEMVVGMYVWMYPTAMSLLSDLADPALPKNVSPVLVYHWNTVAVLPDASDAVHLYDAFAGSRNVAVVGCVIPPVFTTDVGNGNGALTAGACDTLVVTNRYCAATTPPPSPTPPPAPPAVQVYPPAV